MKTYMRGAMYYSNKDVRFEEVPTPVIGPGEVLVKIMSSGICGSDLMEWYRIDAITKTAKAKTARKQKK